MRLAGTTLVIVALPMLVMSGILWIAMTALVSSQFEQLERQQAAGVSGQLRALIDDHLHELTIINQDLAYRDPSRSFAANPGVEFIDSTVLPHTIRGLGLDFCRVRTADGLQSYQRTYQYRDGSISDATLPTKSRMYLRRLSTPRATAPTVITSSPLQAHPG